MFTIKSFAVALIFIFASGNTFASAEGEFDKGVRYFKQQQYKKSINAFKKAHQQGLKKPALFHNLGISHFKLGQYKQAKKYFQHMRRFPKERMQAEYNLGLVAKKQNQSALAKKQFTLVKKQAKNKKLITLARIQLGELKPVKPAEEKTWSAYGSAAYGYDSNVAADPDIDTASHISSTFKAYYADGEVIVFGDEDTGISLNGSAYRTDYSKTDLYGYRYYSLGIQGTFQTGDWDNTLKVRSKKSNYGSIDYQRITQYEVGTKKYLSENTRLRLRYRYYDITSLDPLYDYLEGNRQRLRAGLKIYGTDDYARFYVEHETNDRTNTPTTNYSPTRNTLRAYYNYSFTDALSLRGDVSYRVSTYPAKVTPGREDKRKRYGIRLTYNINKIWKIRGLHEHTDNDSSNAASYSYQRDVTALELIADF